MAFYLFFFFDFNSGFLFFFSAGEWLAFLLYVLCTGGVTSLTRFAGPDMAFFLRNFVGFISISSFGFHFFSCFVGKRQRGKRSAKFGNGNDCTTRTTAIKCTFFNWQKFWPNEVKLLD